METNETIVRIARVRHIARQACYDLQDLNVATRKDARRLEDAKHKLDDCIRASDELLDDLLDQQPPVTQGKQ